MGLILLALLFNIDNSEFNKTVAEQKAQGYKWFELSECRQVTEGLPAITVDSVKGQRVCYKLAKSKADAK